ncbi:hypothetical protein VNO77_05227 [Canavalia gladiata]|uniref:Uncharacterized protein n=1 Tax=Canavalia gladiata TaxID=3824 RepID=A0AAN9N4H5_CANGL
MRWLGLSVDVFRQVVQLNLLELKADSVILYVLFVLISHCSLVLADSDLVFSLISSLLYPIGHFFTVYNTIRLIE